MLHQAERQGEVLLRQDTSYLPGLLHLMPALPVIHNAYAVPASPYPPRAHATTTHPAQIHDP